MGGISKIQALTGYCQFDVPLPVLFFIWYASSVVCTALSKVLLSSVFPSAYWLSLVQFTVAAYVGNVVVRWRTGSPPYVIPAGPPGKEMRTDVWLLSMIFSFGMLALNKGYEHMHVSLVETLRATEPAVSASLATLLMPEEAPTPLQALTLLPCVLGACCSSLGSADFTPLGLLWVLVSNLCFCWRTIKYKQVRIRHCFDDWNLFYQICRKGAVCQLLYAVLGDPRGLLACVTGLENALFTVPLATWVNTLALVLINGAMYYTYLQFSWVILMRVSVVTHAVGNCMRRPVVLVCNVLYFRNEIGLVNAAGICLAFTGVILYTRAKG